MPPLSYMHLHATPALAAEVAGVTQEELDRLARSVEAQRRQLENDIDAYIARKQTELRQYESEVWPNQILSIKSCSGRFLLLLLFLFCARPCSTTHSCAHACGRWTPSSAVMTNAA